MVLAPQSPDFATHSICSISLRDLPGSMLTTLRLRAIYSSNCAFIQSLRFCFCLLKVCVALIMNTFSELNIASFDACLTVPIESKLCSPDPKRPCVCGSAVAVAVAVAFCLPCRLLCSQTSPTFL